jgi:hypothetical protein
MATALRIGSSVGRVAVVELEEPGPRVLPTQPARGKPARGQRFNVGPSQTHPPDPIAQARVSTNRDGRVEIVAIVVNGQENRKTAWCAL